MIQIPIDFSQYTGRVEVKKLEGREMIVCAIRKKYLAPLPEEWVRQATLQYLLERGIKKTRISVERKLLVYGLTKRTDIVIYDENTQPLLLIECKAPFVPITQDTFDQAARYNMSLKAPYFMLVNGVSTYCVLIDHEKQAYTYMESFPI